MTVKRLKEIREHVKHILNNFPSDHNALMMIELCDAVIPMIPATEEAQETMDRLMPKSKGRRKL